MRLCEEKGLLLLWSRSSKIQGFLWVTPAWLIRIMRQLGQICNLPAQEISRNVISSFKLLCSYRDTSWLGSAVHTIHDHFCSCGRGGAVHRGRECNISCRNLGKSLAASGVWGLGLMAISVRSQIRKPIKIVAPNPNYIKDSYRLPLIREYY